MKVLYLTGMYPTPAYPQKGIFCHEQAKALKSAGVDVTVVVPVTFYDREVKEKKWTYEGVEIRYVKFFKLPGTMDFHLTGKSLFRALDRALDLREFDVYHADSPLPTGYAMMLASKKYGVPFIVHGHGLDVFLDVSYDGARNCRKIATVCEEVYTRANAIVGVSQKVLDKIFERVSVQERCYVVYNGVDTEKFTPSEKEKTDEVTILSAGNLIPLKGHGYVLKAFKQVLDKGYENIRCVIAGRGELEDELKALVKELAIEDKVTFTGYVPYDEIKTMMQSADMFILPSYYEALGCVYLESMACGVPAIGCKGNGIDEVIEDGVDGYLVEGKNVEQITERIVEFMDEETRERFGKRAREKVVDKYQWSHSASALIKVYEKVLSGESYGI